MDDEPAEERVERLWRLSGIDEFERERCTFGAFELAANPEMDAAHEAAAAWGRGDGKPTLLLVGAERGIGKTHLAIAAARACIEREEPVAYLVVPKFLDDLRATQRPWIAPSPDNPAPVQPARLEDVRRRAECYPSIILDDFGADRGTDWAAEQLFTVTNERWRKGLRTLVTTNVTPDRIEARTRSRLVDWQRSAVVPCRGDDYRLRGMP